MRETTPVSPTVLAPTRRGRGRPRSVVIVETPSRSTIDPVRGKTTRHKRRRERTPETSSDSDSDSPTVTHKRADTGARGLTKAVRAMQTQMTAQMTAFTMSVQSVNARIDTLQESEAKRRRTRSPDATVTTDPLRVPTPEPRSKTPTPPRPSTSKASESEARPPPTTPTDDRRRPAHYYRDTTVKKKREFVPYISNFKTPAAQHQEDSAAASKSKSSRTPFYEVVSPTDDGDEQRTEVVNDLVSTSGSTSKTKKGNAILAPHRYIYRNNRAGRVAFDQASMPEYFSGLCRMAKDPAMPTSWLEPLQDHLLQLTVMACKYDWHTCRSWSESIFLMIADGRLPYAWADLYAIKDVQRDAVLPENRRPAQGDRGGDHTSRPSTSRNGRSEYVRPSYDRETDGKACMRWNRGEDCGNSTSHGALPDRFCHLCAWCINKYSKANPHKEKECQNKRRFLDRKNNVEPSQDFR